MRRPQQSAPCVLAVISSSIFNILRYFRHRIHSSLQENHALKFLMSISTLGNASNDSDFDQGCGPLCLRHISGHGLYLRLQQSLLQPKYVHVEGEVVANNLLLGSGVVQRRVMPNRSTHPEASCRMCDLSVLRKLLRLIMSIRLGRSELRVLK